MKIDSITNGIVIDHILAGKGMELYHFLHLDSMDCSIALIKNAPSQKMGKKDIIKKKETKRIAAAIPNASLKILPGENHFSYVVHSSKLYPTLDRFFRSAANKSRSVSFGNNWL